MLGARAALCALTALAALGLQGGPVLAGKWINSIAGPWIGSMGPRIMQCAPGKSLHLGRMNMRVSQFRNHAVQVQQSLQRLTGNITLEVPLDSSGMAYVRAASRSNNQWKENAYVLKFPGGNCRATMETFPGVVKAVYGLDPEEQLKRGPKCLIPKGVYAVEDVPVNWSVPKVPVFPYGTYKVELGYLTGPERNAKNLMCMIGEFTIQPKL